MRSGNRTSGIDIIGNIPWGIHFCQFYKTKEDLMDILIPYFKAGLENNEFCLWIISEPVDKEEAKEALKAVIPDIDTYIENEQIEIIPYTCWQVEGGTLDSQTVLNHLIGKTSTALTSGYDGLRYSGNDFFGDEKLLDYVIGKYPMMALCTYSLDVCNVNTSFDIVANHQCALIKREGKWERIESSCQKNNKECDQTEKALQESEERYKAIFDNSLDGIFLTIQDGTILAANPAACKMFGMTEEEIIRAGRNGTVDTSDPRLRYVLEERARTGRFKGELNHRRKDGTIFPGEISSVFFKDKNGLTKGVMIIRDISERKQLEEQTRQRAEEMETIMEVVPTPILIGHDPQGHNITGNRMANEFYEAEVGENISASIPKGRRFFYKGRQLSADELPVQQAALKDIDFRNMELDILLPSGKLRTIMISASPLHNTEGHVRGSVGAFIDITERKKMEAKLKDTLDNLDILVKERTAELHRAYDSLKKSEISLAEAQEIAHIGNWERDFASNEYNWSDEMYRIFGLKPQESKVNYDTFLNYVHPDDRDYIDNAVKKTLKGKPLDTNFRLILANGEERIVHSKAEAVFDEKKNSVRIRGTTQDITEHKKAEEVLAKVEQIRIKEIHHRIKNNLQVISSLLDLQSEAFFNREICETPEVVEAFRESQDRVASMALIHEELYKGDNLDTLDFAAYLNKLAENLSNSYDLGNNDKISLKLNLEQVNLGMDTAIPLGIIVNELVTNSFKHAFPVGKRGEIQINLRRNEIFAPKSEISSTYKDCMEKDGFQYILEVSDNGKGIPEEIDTENSNSLGLQLVNILVEQIDGCIEIENDKGAQFTIWFNNVGI